MISDPLLNYSAEFIKRSSTIIRSFLFLIINLINSSDFILLCNWLNEFGGYSDGLRRIIWKELVEVSSSFDNKSCLELLFAAKLNMCNDSLDALANLYMQILFDSQFKIAFGDMLVKYYRVLVLSICQKPAIGKFLDKLTVQIFTVKDITFNLVKNNSIFEIILNSLHEFLYSDCDNNGKISFKSSIFLNNYYWSITHDINFIFSHNDIVASIF